MVDKRTVRGDTRRDDPTRMPLHPVPGPACRMSWFTDLTGLSDDRAETVRDGLRVEGTTLHCPNGRALRAGRLDLSALADLRALTPDLGTGRLSARTVRADARALHADPDAAGALFQVASQFNLLEMVGPDVTPEDGIAGYVHDRTQGPACAMACAAGTIWRAYYGLDGAPQTARRQIDAAADLAHALSDGTGAPWRMRNGYLLPEAAALDRIGARIGALDADGRDALAGSLRIGVQADTEVTLPGAGHLVHQAYCSAVPVSYSGHPADAWAPLARLVLDAAYEATLRAAVTLGAPRVYLTLLGGGAFGNRTAWILAAIDRALDACGGADLDVVVVSYGPPDADLLSLAPGDAA